MEISENRSSRVKVGKENLVKSKTMVIEAEVHPVSNGQCGEELSEGEKISRKDGPQQTVECDGSNKQISLEGGLKSCTAEQCHINRLVSQNVTTGLPSSSSVAQTSSSLSTKSAGLSPISKLPKQNSTSAEVDNMTTKCGSVNFSSALKTSTSASSSVVSSVVSPAVSSTHFPQKAQNQKPSSVTSDGNVASLGKQHVIPCSPQRKRTHKGRAKAGDREASSNSCIVQETQESVRDTSGDDVCVEGGRREDDEHRVIEDMVCAEDFTDSFVFESQLEGSQLKVPRVDAEVKSDPKSKVNPVEQLSRVQDKKSKCEWTSTNRCTGKTGLNDSVVNGYCRKNTLGCNVSKVGVKGNSCNPPTNNQINRGSQKRKCLPGTVHNNSDKNGIQVMNNEKPDGVISSNDLPVNCDNNDLNLSSSLLSSHDVSCDLLPASNFECCMMVDDESDVSRNESYRDLRIPYHSGQEACFIDNEKKVPPTQGGYDQLSQDLVLALELSNTFPDDTIRSQTKTIPQQSIVAKVGDTNNGNKKQTIPTKDSDASSGNKKDLTSLVVADQTKEAGDKIDNCVTTCKKPYQCVRGKEASDIQSNETQEMNDSLTLSMMCEVLEKSDTRQCNMKSDSTSDVASSDAKFTKIKTGKASQCKDKRLSPGTLAFLDDLHSTIATDSSVSTGQSPPPENTGQGRKTRCAKRQGNTRQKADGRRTKRKSIEGTEGCQEKKSREDRSQECLSPTPPRPSQVNSPQTIRKATPNRLRSQKQGARTNSVRKCIDTGKASQKRGEKGTVHNDLLNFEQLHHEDGIEDLADVVELPCDERGPVVDPNNTGIPPSQGTFTIIDVCADRRLFETFIAEWQGQSIFALSLACRVRPEDPAPPAGKIGAKFSKAGSAKHCTKGMKISR
jgi:hypothetical protein